MWAEQKGPSTATMSYTMGYMEYLRGVLRQSLSIVAIGKLVGYRQRPRKPESLRCAVQQGPSIVAV